MNGRLEKTQAMLARHHRDGERFAQSMREGFARRFDEAFWADWRRWIEPAYSAAPVVLDLGAGPGMFLRALVERTPGLRAVGVECAPYMIEAAGELPDGCELLCEDLHEPALPLPPGSVDAALASVVIHEMDQPVRALQALARAMRPGGRFLLLDWVRAPLEVYLRHQWENPARLFDPATPTAEVDDLLVHFMEHNRFSREDLIYLLNHTGFAVIDSSLHKEGRYARIVAERRA